jgi:beta-lactam-binding protein with PASTA domain
MKRIFTLVLGALAMVAVALVSAFITMRLAIHGREAVVPALTGLSVSEATGLAARQGLQLNLENRFYSADVATGQVLAQDPAPGFRVRREWPIRITESLGTQAVSIPDLTGESERAATVSIRRLSLDLGAVAHLAVPGDPDVVLTQTPPANSNGVDGPRVSLLVSDSPDAATQAYVMPSLLGLSYATARARADAAGLHLVVAPGIPPAAPPASGPPSGLPSGLPPAAPPISAAAPAAPSATPAPPDQIAPAPLPNGIIVGQYPQPGYRVESGDAVHVTLAQPAPAAAPAPGQ